MNDPASTSSITAKAPGHQNGASADAPAIFVLDKSGRILGANESARQLWQAGEHELIHEPFAALFVFEVVSTDPEFLEAQWDALLATALDRPARFTAQPRGGVPREVRVRIEKSIGASAAFLATVDGRGPVEQPAARDTDETSAAYRLLAEKGGAGFFELNFQSGHVRFSPAWKKQLGYAGPELADTLETWHELVHPDDSGAAPHRLSKKVVVGTAGATRSFNVEFRMKNRRGYWTWIQSIGVQIISPSGELERVVGIHLDITERKELEDALVANDARLQDLSAAGPLAAFELDFSNGVFWFSPAWEKLLGFSEAELAPEAASFGLALPPEEASAGVEAWLLARSPGETSFVETVRLRAKDGRPVPVVLGAYRSSTRRRELLRVVGFAVPLTAGLPAEEGAIPGTLAETVFATMSEAVLIADARGKIVFVNPPAARLLRAEAAAIRGQGVGDIFRVVNRQSLRPADDPVDRALAADQPLPLIGTDALLPCDASASTAPTPIVWTARAAYDGAGKPAGVTIVFRNPDEMTLTPEELVRANRSESLALLAGGIAHDFNNLLTTILGGVSLAKDTHDYAPLNDVEKACDAAKGLTKQLLAFAKGGTGQQLACAPNTILHDSVKIAAAASSAEIKIEVADGTDNVLVDRAQILQVFQNLIVNALQAMPPPPHKPRLLIRAGNISLAENQVPSLPAGEYVEFEVRDNGSGIKPEHVERIFDPFFTTKKHGTGLGLATVLSMVRKHGGQIGLDTQVGVGTAFTVYLPKADQAVDLQARKAPTLRFGTGRILFMDDDPKISALTGTMLQSLDYKYDLAKNGEEAIALYKRYLNIGRPYDAVVMDLTVVGGMGGDECFTELRKLDPEVRAIIASGYDNEEMAQQYLEKGFCGYLTKPYRVADLGKVLKTVLGS